MLGFIRLHNYYIYAHATFTQYLSKIPQALSHNTLDVGSCCVQPLAYVSLHRRLAACM
jgi:hypothetical protein